MNILIAISNTKDPSTGTAVVSLRLVEQYKALGMTVDAIFIEDLLPRRSGVFGQILFSVLLPIRFNWQKYDVLDINSGDGVFIGILVRWFARKSRPVMVARSHGLEHAVHQMFLAEKNAGKLELSWKYPLYHGGLRLWMVKQYLRHADLALLLNKYDRDFAVDVLGVRPERAHVVDNGIPDAFIGLPVSFERNISGPNAK